MRLDLVLYLNVSRGTITLRSVLYSGEVLIRRSGYSSHFARAHGQEAVPLCFARRSGLGLLG